MHIETLQEGHSALVRPEAGLPEPGELKAVIETLKLGGYRSILLDLLHREWLSSAEIGSVMWLFKQLEETGSRLYLLADSSFILKTIHVTGIDQLLTIFDSKEKALDYIT
jgi:anti-sigma B factor antagonist